MTKIYNFPDVPIAKQLFHVPGSANEGGLTSGGARIISPDPGGRCGLEMQVAWRDEFDTPHLSWVMSKINGHIFRIRLTRTPQILTTRSLPVPTNGTKFIEPTIWDAGPIVNDLIARYTLIALEGSNSVTIDMTAIGPFLKPGHVIGHGDNAYMVDEIDYDDGIATVVVTPPLRNDIAVNDPVLFRPYFLGTISNGESIRATYDAENVGWLQPGMITFNEAVV